MIHPHADMIIEAAKDTNIKWQSRQPRTIPQQNWQDCIAPPGGLVAFIDEFEYRKKPREFNEGEWYPCVDYDDDESVRVFKAGFFFAYNVDGGYDGDMEEINFTWIGKSLGKLKFG